jgi:hypothetical protein
MAVPGAVLPRIASPTAAQRGSVVLAIRRAREAKIIYSLDRDPRPDDQASRHPHPLLHSHGGGWAPGLQLHHGPLVSNQPSTLWADRHVECHRCMVDTDHSSTAVLSHGLSPTSYLPLFFLAFRNTVYLNFLFPRTVT